MIIAVVPVFHGRVSDYPLRFVLPSILAFSDKVLLYCNRQDDKDWILELGLSAERWQVVQIPLAYEKQNIASMLTAALAHAQSSHGPKDVIVSCHADMFLTEDWRNRFGDWLRSPSAVRNKPFYSPLMRVCLYSFNPLNHETVWGGTIAVTNSRAHKYVLDGSFLSEQPGIPMTNQLPGFDLTRLYQVEMGQCSLKQVAMKDLRNERIWGRTGTIDFYGFSAEWLRTGNTASYLSKYIAWVRTYGQWAGASFANHRRFVVHPIGRAFVDMYGLKDEMADVGKFLWDAMKNDSRAVVKHPALA